MREGLNRPVPTQHPVLPGPKKRRNTEATAAEMRHIAFIGRAPGGAWENLDETFEEVFFDWLAAEDAPKRLCLLSGQPATATSREATRDGHNAAGTEGSAAFVRV